VSPVENLDRSVIATGFPYDHGDYADEYSRVVGAVLASVNGIRRFGSAALDLAWVAAGRYEAYWELGLAPWDQAAGILIVREAGGRVTDLYGTNSVPTTPLVLASNGLVHEGLQRVIEPLLPDRLR
jgi:myo-inositol-1(or 4)-monophosphatase